MKTFYDLNYSMDTSFYDSNYNCSYNDDDIILDTDNINDDEKEFVRNCVYRQDILNIFKLDDYDEMYISDKIKDLYLLVKDNIDFYKCIENASLLVLSNDYETGLFVLYSYDYLYLTHKCMCDFFRNGIVSKDNIELLQHRLEAV